MPRCFIVDQNMNFLRSFASRVQGWTTLLCRNQSWAYHDYSRSRRLGMLGYAGRKDDRPPPLIGSRAAAMNDYFSPADDHRSTFLDEQARYADVEPFDPMQTYLEMRNEPSMSTDYTSPLDKLEPHAISGLMYLAAQDEAHLSILRSDLTAVGESRKSAYALATLARMEAEKVDLRSPSGRQGVIDKLVELASLCAGHPTILRDVVGSWAPFTCETILNIIQRHARPSQLDRNLSDLFSFLLVRTYPPVFNLKPILGPHTKLLVRRLLTLARLSAGRELVNALDLIKHFSEGLENVHEPLKPTPPAPIQVMRLVALQCIQVGELRGCFLLLGAMSALSTNQTTLFEIQQEVLLRFLDVVPVTDHQAMKLLTRYLCRRDIVQPFSIAQTDNRALRKAMNALTSRQARRAGIMPLAWHIFDHYAGDRSVEALRAINFLKLQHIQELLRYAVYRPTLASDWTVLSTYLVKLFSSPGQNPSARAAHESLSTLCRATAIHKAARPLALQFWQSHGLLVTKKPMSNALLVRISRLIRGRPVAEQQLYTRRLMAAYFKSRLPKAVQKRPIVRARLGPVQLSLLVQISADVGLVDEMALWIKRHSVARFVPRREQVAIVMQHIAAGGSPSMAVFVLDRLFQAGFRPDLHLLLAVVSTSPSLASLRWVSSTCRQHNIPTLRERAWKEFKKACAQATVDNYCRSDNDELQKLEQRPRFKNVLWAIRIANMSHLVGILQDACRDQSWFGDWHLRQTQDTLERMTLHRKTKH